MTSSTTEIQTLFEEFTTPKQKTESIRPSIEEYQQFFGGDLTAILDQGPIRKNPLKKETPVVEEPIDPEMEQQIKEVFGENYKQIIR